MFNIAKKTLKDTPAFYDTLMAARLLRSQLKSVLRPNDWSIGPVELATNPEKYILCHWSISDNFGDAASPLVVRMLSGREVVPLSQCLNIRGLPSYSVVGSVLQFQGTSRTQVWGSGFISAERRFTWKPSKVHAVRGPLTRARCLAQGVDCPPVYGDPAVFLFDSFTDMPRNASYKVGIIPHYADSDHPRVQQFAEHGGVKLIDVMQSPSQVAKEVLECEVVISSSLHGLILADSLGIPNRWLGVSDNVLKGGFKFQDYFASVRRDEPLPLGVDDLTISKAVKEAHLTHTPFSRDLLLEACPFRRCR